jgi:hypothetical protein
MPDEQKKADENKRAWHWYETIAALAPLNRFYDLVPVNGVYELKNAQRSTGPAEPRSTPSEEG